MYNVSYTPSAEIIGSCYLSGIAVLGGGLKTRRYTTMKLVIIILILSFVLLTIGCKETVVENKNSKNGYVQLSKDKVEIGEKIIAHFINMDSASVYSVTFNKKDVTFYQSDSNTVSLIVPYTDVGNDIGNFVFYCWMRTNNSYPDTVLVSNQINYKYENLPYKAYVKWNTNENVTLNDSRVKNFFGQYKWQIKTARDTIKLIRMITCHDECGEVETLVFLNNGNNVLPNFLYSLYERNEWLKAPIRDTVKNLCKIMIDSWDSTLIYSGTFSSSDYSWVFWYKK